MDKLVMTKILPLMKCDGNYYPMIDDTEGYEDLPDCRCSEIPALEEQVGELEAIKKNDDACYRKIFADKIELRKALEEIIPMLHQIGVHPTTRLLKIKARIDNALAEGRSE